MQMIYFNKSGRGQDLNIFGKSDVGKNLKISAKMIVVELALMIQGGLWRLFIRVSFEVIVQENSVAHGAARQSQPSFNHENFKHEDEFGSLSFGVRSNLYCFGQMDICLAKEERGLVMGT